MMTGEHRRPRSGALKKFLLFGLPVLAVVLAAALYFTIWYVPSTGLSDADQRRVENYLRRVDADLLKMQIDSPPEDNAVFKGFSAIKNAQEIRLVERSDDREWKQSVVHI